jgi:hypothetical protein
MSVRCAQEVAQAEVARSHAKPPHGASSVQHVAALLQHTPLPQCRPVSHSVSPLHGVPAPVGGTQPVPLPLQT